MAEYHIAGGDLPLAVNQLELALSVPNLTGVQRSKFSARLKELREAMPKERARLERVLGTGSPGPGRLIRRCRPCRIPRPPPRIAACGDS